MPVLDSEKKYAEELIVELPSRAYSLITAPLKNGTGAAVAINDIVGWPVKLVGSDWEIAKAADSNTVDGVVMKNANLKTTNTAGEPQRSVVNLASGATSTEQYLIVVRDAILNLDAMPDKDAANANFDKTQIATSLLACNPPILLAREPRIQYTQET